MAEALRYNQGKPDLSYTLDLPAALGALARVFEQGAIKYEDGNWKLGGKPDREYLASALRHLAKHKGGELYDPETGCLHAAHALWNIAVLLELNVTADVPALDPDFDQAAFERLCEARKAKTYEAVEAFEPGIEERVRRSIFKSDAVPGRNTVDL